MLRKKVCDSGSTIWYSGNDSYIEAVKWKDFIVAYDTYIDRAYERQEDID